jgi:tetratricopeptide (TPR) repeat protein
VLVVLFPFLMRVFAIPARDVLGMYLVADNLLPLIVTFGRAGGGVAHGAHIGGFLAGLAGAWLVDRRLVATVPADYATATDQAPRDGGVEDAIRRGDGEAAARAYFANPSAVFAPDTTVQLGDWLAEQGHAEAALAVYGRHIRDHPQGPGTAEAHLGAGLLELGAGQLAPAYQHLRRVLELDPASETRSRANAALQVIAGRQKYPMRRFASSRPLL